MSGAVGAKEPVKGLAVASRMNDNDTTCTLRAAPPAVPSLTNQTAPHLPEK